MKSMVAWAFSIRRKLKKEGHMRAFYRSLVIGAAFSMAMGIASKTAISATVLSEEKISQIVMVRNVTVKDGAVSGEVVNTSRRTLREVQLLIPHSWLWKNEFQPGKDDPGTAAYYTVEKEIAPGASARFTYNPPSPLPSRADGYFETTVSVAGFTEVIR